MEPCTMNKQFLKQDVISDFHSLIWTDRFYGDSEVELVVPLTVDYVRKFQEGTFLCIDESDEPMIIETVNIEDGKIKATGISICSWLNNRFIRASANHRIKVWKIRNQKPGPVLSTIVRQMCTSDSTYLNGPNSMGIGNEVELIITGLKARSADATTVGKKRKITKVNYGPVYDELKRIAQQNKIGMRVILESVTSSGFTLAFQNYKGLDRTTRPSGSGKPVRFSVKFDSFADIKELRSLAPQKTLVYSFASSLDKKVDIDPADDTENMQKLHTRAGVARLQRDVGKYTGFDLRAKILFADDISNDDFDDAAGTVAQKKDDLRDMLDDAAERELKKNKRIQTVDGEVGSANLFIYKRDYSLGDIIEVEGLTGAIEYSRVIEYIRTQDASGETAYPTVEAIEP